MNDLFDVVKKIVLPMFVVMFFCLFTRTILDALASKDRESQAEEIVRIEAEVLISNFYHSSGGSSGYAIPVNGVYVSGRAYTSSKYKVYVMYNGNEYSIDDYELYHEYNGRIGDMATGVFIERNGIFGKYLKLIDIKEKDKIE